MGQTALVVWNDAGAANVLYITIVYSSWDGEVKWGEGIALYFSYWEKYTIPTPDPAPGHHPNQRYCEPINLNTKP